MTSLAFCIAAVLGATQVWTASSLTDVAPGEMPDAQRNRDARIGAARGEYEAFQVCVQSPRKALEQLRVEPGPLDGEIGPPEVYRVGSVSLAKSVGEHTSWPDALLPPDPADIAAGETAVFWVTYYIPPQTKPGLHRGKLRLRWGSRVTRDVPVAVEVFDFALPSMPSLPTLFRLDARALQRVYGLKDTAVETYTPFYNALAEWRIGFGVAGIELTSLAFEEHLAYAVAKTNMAAIDLSQAGHDLGAFPEPELALLADSLQRYLLETDRWLESKGWANRAVMPFPSAGPRSRWIDARHELFRVQRADRRIRRLVPGPLHPYFERYAEIVAVPLDEAAPEAVLRFRNGLSLADDLCYPPSAVLASSSDEGVRAPYPTAPEDGYDGCAFTAWQSASVPTGKAPEWFEVRFPNPIRADALRLWWATGYEPSDVRVNTSADGAVFSSATTDWTGTPAPNGVTCRYGRFKVDKIIRAMRLEFRAASANGPLRLIELDFGPEQQNRPAKTIPPAEVWLRMTPGAFPSPNLAASPAEIRAIGWGCWTQGLKGVLGGELAAWPSSWNAASIQAPVAPDTAPLVYPGPAGPLPSIRLARLRDGLEDYEYLALCEERLDDTEKTALQMRISEIPPRDFEALAREIESKRVDIGRALSSK